MRFHRISLSFAAALILLTTLPAAAQTDRRTFQADYDRTWAATLATFEQNSMPIATAEKSTGLIRSMYRFVPQNPNQWVDSYTTQTVRALSGWADVQIDLTVVVAHRDDDATDVKIETGISVYNGWTEIWRTLSSSGTLERAMFDAIQTQLDSAPASSGGFGSPAGEGTVSLSSKPDKAEVEVDGAFIGQTPAKLTLSAGKHTIRVTRKGYGEWTRTLQVMPGATTNLDVELSKP